MQKQNIPWEAISAKLKNDADGEQLKQIQDWLDSSPENSIILNEIMNTWLVTRKSNKSYQPDLVANWNKLMNLIDFSEKPKKPYIVYFRWAAAAAILVMVFLAGTGLGDRIFNQSAKITYTKIIAPEGSKTQVVLPDSTYVWLNSGSELKYPSDYSAQNRVVTMKGECFFDVVKDTEHPMVVSGSKFKVKVYGTRFNVNEHNVKNLADVTLVSGKVQVFNLQDKLISDIKPGQQLVFDDGKYHIQKAENLEALTAWLNNMLIFDNQPFEEVIHYLENWYGVKIQLDKDLYYKHNYTFKVKTESLREVMELISVITPIQYKIEGEQVNIKYKKR